MEDEMQFQLDELIDEIDIILSVKNHISEEEISNFKDKFNLLSEFDIRKKITEVTDDSVYVENFNENNKLQSGETIKFDSYKLKDAIEKDEYDIKNEDFNFNKNNNEEFIDINKESEDMSIKNIKEYSFDENNIPKIPFIRAEIKYGQLSVEWEWPKEIDEVLICCRMDKFPMNPHDLSSQHIELKKEGKSNTGNYVINKVVEGNYYFAVYCKVNLNEKICYSEGVRRLVVNKAPLEIFYQIKNKKTIFGKIKSSEIVISTVDKEINLPQLILVGKKGNMPIQKSDGENIVNIDYQNITREKSAIIQIPYEDIEKNTYVKLFFLDDTNSKLYRIISPAKEKLYFK